MKRRLLPAAALLVTLAAAGCQGDDQDALSIVVALPRQHVSGVAKATLLVDYSAAGARILSEGTSPSCAFILPGISGDFSDDHRGNLTIHTSGPRALGGPADIAACRMKAGSAGTSVADIQAKLTVQVTAAEDTAGKPIDLAAKATKHGATGRNESEIEAAQEEAIKAAASAVPPPPPPPSDAAGGTAAGTKPGAPIVMPPLGAAGQATASGGGANPPPKPSQPATPRATPAPGAILHNPAGAGTGAGPGANNGNGDGAIPTNQDRDPGYDDRDSDDASAPAYNLVLAVGASARIGALQIELTHLGNRGGFIGRGDTIECTSLVEAIVAANYLGERVAKIGMISLQGIPAPSNLMSCGFRTREPLSPASFLVQVTDASGTDSNQLETPPSVTISSISRR